MPLYSGASFTDEATSTVNGSSSTSSTISSDGSAPPATATAASDRGRNSTSTSGAVPRRVAVFVEPSPFTYVCGYKNRFTTMVRHLQESGCEVLLVTTGAAFAPF